MTPTCHCHHTPHHPAAAPGAPVNQPQSTFTGKILDYVLPRNEVTGKREIRIIPLGIEKFLGSLNYDSICPMRSTTTDAALTAKVQHIFKKLVDQCPRKNLDWEIRVMKDDATVNAFCLPGGKVVITTGMINKLNSRLDATQEEQFKDLTFEDNVAAVLGHEITHAAAGHSARAIQFNLLLFTVGKIISYVVIPFYLLKDRTRRDSARTAEAAAQGVDLLCRFATYLFVQKNSRDHEFEADEFGIKLAHKAGFNIQASERLQVLFLEMSGKKVGANTHAVEKGLQLFSSHPPSQERLDKNRATILQLTTPS